jgi:hypothetical protein
MPNLPGLLPRFFVLLEAILSSVGVVIICSRFLTETLVSGKSDKKKDKEKYLAVFETFPFLKLKAFRY